LVVAVVVVVISQEQVVVEVPVVIELIMPAKHQEVLVHLPNLHFL
jgi:hypothetical protein